MRSAAYNHKCATRSAAVNVIAMPRDADGLWLALCDITDGGACRVLRGHRGSVLTLFALDNLMLSGGRDNVIRCQLGVTHIESRTQVQHNWLTLQNMRPHAELC